MLTLMRRHRRNRCRLDAEPLVGETVRRVQIIGCSVAGAVFLFASCVAGHDVILRDRVRDISLAGPVPEPALDYESKRATLTFDVAAANRGAGPVQDSATVASVIDRFHRALATGDTAVVETLLVEDAVILESGGVESREEYFAGHLPADIAFARAVPRERGPIRVAVHGDVAWATSTSTSRGEYRGRTINSAGSELVVLRRTNGGWRIAAIHWSSRQLRS